MKHREILSNPLPDALDADVLEPDYPEDLLEADLRAAGLEPAEVERRGRALADALFGAEPTAAVASPTPPARPRERLRHAAASAGTLVSVKWSGVGSSRVSVDLRAHFSGATDGYLELAWSVGTYHPEGWELVLTPLDGPEVTINLGRATEGRRRLTWADLGFDPVRQLSTEPVWFRPR